MKTQDKLIIAQLKKIQASLDCMKKHLDDDDDNLDDIIDIESALSKIDDIILKILV